MCLPLRLVLVLVLAGCGGEEARLKLRSLYEANPGDLAAPPHEWEGTGCAEASSQLGQCLAVRITTGAGCDEDQTGVGDVEDCVRLLRGPGPEGTGDPLVSLQGPFDLATRDATRDDLWVRLGMYDGDGALLATGEVHARPLREGHPLVVTLMPVGDAVSCGDPLQSSVLNRRAFHSATLLPNGELLLVGGIQGPLQFHPNGNALEESVDVFDPATGLGTRLVVENEVSDERGPQVFRTFHSAAYLPRADDGGRYRVRLFGGIRAIGGQPVVWIDKERNDTPLNLPLSGIPEAELAPTVDLIYDPAEDRVVVQPVEGEGDVHPHSSFGVFAPLTEGLGTEARPGKVSRGYYFGGGLGPWGGTAIGDVEPVRAGFVVDQKGETSNASPQEMIVGRLGATATAIGEDEVLVWGGNLWSVADVVDDPDVDAQAKRLLLRSEMAEVLRPTTDEAPELVVPTGAPVVPTAFHAAADALVDGDGVHHIVVAGGYQVSISGTVSTVDFSPVPLYLVSYDPARRSAVVTEARCRDRAGDAADCADVFGDVAFLTATWIQPGQVLLVGGNFIYTYRPDAGGTVATRYGARALAGVVTVEDGVATFDPVDLGTARYGHTATRLADGAVLIFGGMTLHCDPDDDGQCSNFGNLELLKSYEIYNPGLAFRALPEGACDQL